MTVIIIDPSTKFRPDDPEFAAKLPDAFRDYSKGGKHFERVKRTYRLMHTNQTVQFGLEQRKKWMNFDHESLTIMDALDRLNELIDESDPDCDVPNVYHAYQTAEAIRKVYPDRDWMHLVGLIHDLGKIMCFYDQPQWAAVGDIYPVGCAPAKEVVYSADTFDECSDQMNPNYNTKLGMYAQHCGINNLQMSWGHDEYLFQVLKNHGATLPSIGMYMIRFHSFYPWHTGKAYDYFCTEEDLKMREEVKAFSSFDLYTKSDEALPDKSALREYYQKLIDKYIPGKVNF